MSIAGMFSAHAASLVDAAARSTAQIKTGERGIGTGVVWRADDKQCEILTNAHVVTGAAVGALRVTLNDGREARAVLVDSDETLDLALLRITLSGAAPARFALTGGPRVGEIVFALGNPWGQIGVVTRGVVSGSGEIKLRGGRTARYIRSDVQLAPGNSGGPLVNAAGEVIGINAMIFGGDLSVAIPADVVAAWTRAQPWQRQAQHERAC